MIEKLKPHPCIDANGVVYGEIQPDNQEMTEKINELVDAVNELQLVKDVMFNRIDMLNNTICDIQNRITALDDPTYHEAEPEYKNKNVKQAEKWMYCLCRFWNDGCDSYYGELVNIDTRVSSDAPFERDTGDWYQCCEPVKPDDDIIYKGGDNE